MVSKLSHFCCYDENNIKMATNKKTGSKGWNIVLWIAQVLLAAMFLMVGAMKTFIPIDELSATLPLAAEMPGLTHFIGISELAGGLGLILPAALRILPHLTIVAAWAICLVMILALLFHLFRSEYSALPTNLILALIAAFVAWGRKVKSPIHQKFTRIESQANS